ncbi:MAG: class I SAM-dependent methyltransferase [Candidatus Limnocylindrales bacterium]
MPFRPTFDCLWCGRAWTVRAADDLEGWAQLCPDCLGRAGDNGFLRQRLHQALAERGKAHAAAGDGALGGEEAAAPVPGAGSRPGSLASPPAADPAAELVAYYEARAGEYDDWYLRRGRYSHGPLDDLAWQMELDQATLWLDAMPLRGRLVELAAGTGWWSPLLAGKGELWCYDAAAAPLDRARERLLAHGLRAHLHLRDAWAEPEPPPADALFLGFWLSHVPRARLHAFLALARRWLTPDGRLAFVDSRRDRASGASGNGWDPHAETATRRLTDGRTFVIPKVYYEPGELEAALLAAGFGTAEVSTTSRFFLLGQATAA